MACYRKDPPLTARPPKECRECGAKLSTRTATRCGRCYRERRGDAAVASTRACGDCGGAVSSGARRCADCHVKHTTRLRTARHRDAEPVPAFRPAAALPYADARATWDRVIGRVKPKFRGPAAPRDPGARRKVAVLSDLHVPMHDPDLLADFFERTRDADVCVSIGDLSESFSVSGWVKYASIGWREEFAALQVVIEELSSRYPRVVCVIGNHDRRLEKRVRGANLSQDAVDAVVSLTGGTLDPVRAIVKGLGGNIEIADWAVPGTVPPVVIDWFCMVGDAWIGHGEAYSRIPGAVMRKTASFLANSQKVLGLPAHPRLVCCGHTHQLGMIPHESGQLLVETGCLVSTQRYMVTADSVRSAGPPQRRGFVQFEQDRVDGGWVTDLNSVRLHWYDVDGRVRG